MGLPFFVFLPPIFVYAAAFAFAAAMPGWRALAVLSLAAAVLGALPWFIIPRNANGVLNQASTYAILPSVVGMATGAPTRVVTLLEARDRPLLSRFLATLGSLVAPTISLLIDRRPETTPPAAQTMQKAPGSEKPTAL